MGREHARILCRIWSDPDFKARSEGAQRMYFLLLSQRLLSHAGVVPMTVRKWANCAEDSDVASVHAHLDELIRHDYVVIDEDTQELLVRSFIRNDGVAKQPNVLIAALRQAAEIESATLRLALAGELRKLGDESADRVADRIEPDFAEPFGNPCRTLAEGCATPADQAIVDNVVDESVDSVDNSRETLPEPLANPSTGPRDERGGRGKGKGEKEKKEMNAQARGDPAFDEFYAAYPKHVGRKAALTAWAKAIKDGTDPATVIAGAKRYADERRTEDPKYTKQPATWLNQGCWTDEPQTTGYRGFVNPDPSAYYEEL